MLLLLTIILGTRAGQFTLSVSKGGSLFIALRDNKGAQTNRLVPGATHSKGK